MEFVDGTSLEAVLAAEGRLAQKRAVDIAIQICSALQVAHQLGVIHRDIKPENIMLVTSTDDDGGPRDIAKVCDFGMAKLQARGVEGETQSGKGLVFGSPAYMAPEHVRDNTCNEQTDIYAVGVTLFEMLTGELPHNGASLAELFEKKSTEPPTRPSRIVEGIDPLLEDIVLHALARDPRIRQSSAATLRSELTEVLDHISPQSAGKPAKVSIWPERVP
jgi:serine/threonine-protein kinase